MYDGKEFEIILTKEKGEEIYYDILLPERNVELISLRSLDDILTENTYALYIKDGSMEIVLINKIDTQYNYAYVQIYKSNIPSYFLFEN